MRLVAWISSRTPSELLDLLQQLFNVGDRVRCVVVNIDKSSRRLSLSTAVLEENKGDMLVNKVTFLRDRHPSDGRQSVASLQWRWSQGASPDSLLEQSTAFNTCYRLWCGIFCSLFWQGVAVDILFGSVDLIAMRLALQDKVYANAEKQAEVFRAWAALPPEERAPEHSDDRVASRGGSRQTDDLEWDSRS